ncbi:MAG: glutamine--fructose-6-phosphate aminotransferase [Epulopiscium sp. Nuni2H_MBin003]|nr:MAG: glutamine--fructose-6-phosphate aminotransferase [Epulopiscium sp. Nuni2H_MBin003]
MCGIVGYIGFKNELDVKDVLLSGLSKLEYRGYDSAGICIYNEGIHIFKDAGRVEHLKTLVDDSITANLGIGHTRWATHGKPSKRNSHPHQSLSTRFTVVHNGVIENEIELREKYLSNYPFVSETDTEVIVALIEKFVMEGTEPTIAIRQVMGLIKGSYAIGIIDSETPDKFYAAKNKSPLLIGLGNNFNMIGSDAMSIIKYTNKFIEIYDQEFIVLAADKVSIYSILGNQIERNYYVETLDAADTEKGVYPHYMLKEIDEQPFALRRLISEYFTDTDYNIDADITDTLRNTDRIYIIAAGTSMHAGLVGKQFFEQIANIPTEVHISSEFIYNTPLINDNPLFIFLSQSGETADSRAVLVKIKELGFKSLTITNAKGSTLSREADYTLLIHAGVEIAVASTKAYTSQIAVMAILATKEAEIDATVIKKDLSLIANVIEGITDNKTIFKELADQYLTKRSCFYIGRHIDYFVAVEAALKLKEISYIQTEGFAAGELKHGTIALIEEGTPVIAIISQENINLNTRSNIKEVKSRGASTIIISLKSLSSATDQIVIDDVSPILSPIVTIVPTQLLAYYAALSRGLDIDKPRNLAKSVTVE